MMDDRFEVGDWESDRGVSLKKDVTADVAKVSDSCRAHRWVSTFDPDNKTQHFHDQSGATQHNWCHKMETSALASFLLGEEY
jgi:hypothetical protein